MRYTQSRYDNRKLNPKVLTPGIRRSVRTEATWLPPLVLCRTGVGDTSIRGRAYMRKGDFNADSISGTWHVPADES